MLVDTASLLIGSTQFDGAVLNAAARLLVGSSAVSSQIDRQPLDFLRSLLLLLVIQMQQRL